MARADTLRYLAALPDVSLSDYATALHHWETTLAALWQGLRLSGRFSDPIAKWYENGDGSNIERLNHMYNLMKHVDKAITAGQVLPDSMTPVWLANDGLKSVDHALTYEEIAELLTDMEEVATLIQDPVALGQRQQVLKDAADAAEGGTRHTRPGKQVLPIDVEARGEIGTAEARDVRALVNGSVRAFRDIARWNGAVFDQLNRSGQLLVPSRTLTGDQVSDDPRLVTRWTRADVRSHDGRVLANAPCLPE